MEKSRPAFKFLRILLGLFLIAYALNKFLHIIPNSYGQMPEAAESFLDAVVSYLPLLYIFEILIGIFLLANKWKSFIYILLFPLSLAFLMFSIINKDFTEMWPALLVVLLNVILLFSRKETYKILFD
ncbi:MAG: hypothetical protein CL596_00380 [Alteromonas sp.]|nr:hypothetical protein [Alteromonas sp.]MAY22919.1 hypothetical protein [Flavobacteriaceae bacterium]|tara:strand:- start:4928 stop:5308 length:381 start_codon:yes stop_codon:yes gene_type:complete